MVLFRCGLLVVGTVQFVDTVTLERERDRERIVVNKK